MTGFSVFHRQMSSNAGTSNVDRSSRPKFRRCSSADEQNALEPIPDDIFYKSKLRSKGARTPSDIDSGTEDSQNEILNSSNHSQKNDDEDEQSVIFVACEDEGYAETRVPTPTNDAEVWTLEKIREELELAARIPHELKKTFCLDTRQVFHAEFARLISIPINLAFPQIHYYLCAFEEWPFGCFDQNSFDAIFPLNAKAQFQCTQCKRLWTSMRARIAFYVTQPRPNGMVVLRIFGQACSNCGGDAEALWYMEEVCRVMEDLTNMIYEHYFPGVFTPIVSSFSPESNSSSARTNSYNPKQRKGKMSAPHDRNRCRACLEGMCFPDSM